jgi:hypothetical protein
MAVNGVGKNRESGQSVLEFIFMLPVLVGMMMLMTHVNTAIQMAIVDQQYARAQALWLTFNSPYYPQLSSIAANFQEQKFNSMVIGISDNASPDTGTYAPESSTQIVARNKRLAGRKGNPGSEENQLGQVRIRDTVTLCTQSNVIQLEGGNTVPYTADSASKLGEGFDPKAFMYCRSPLDE